MQNLPQSWHDGDHELCRIRDRGNIITVAVTPERHDIGTREDIALLVETFYTRAFADPVLGPIFVDVVQLDLEAHMPIMCDFWEGILLGVQKYPGGMMMVHFQVHQKVTLEPHHFQRWLDYWVETVDDLFAGERAAFAKLHAGRVAVAMSQRFEQLPGGPPVTASPRNAP